jgi:hypothetical protein
MLTARFAVSVLLGLSIQVSLAGTVATNVALTSSVNPCITGQPLTLTVGVTPVAASGFVTSIWPTGQSLPVVSTLNSYDGRVTANAAPAGTNGSISI